MTRLWALLVAGVGVLWLTRAWGVAVLATAGLAGLYAVSLRWEWESHRACRGHGEKHSPLRKLLPGYRRGCRSRRCDGHGNRIRLGVWVFRRDHALRQLAEPRQIRPRERLLR